MHAHMYMAYDYEGMTLWMWHPYSLFYFLQISRNIKDYLHLFRTNFTTEAVPPKMHLLKEHIVPWLATMGTMGEQGGESIHAQINNIKRDLQGYTNDLDLLLRSIRGQWLASNPQTYKLYM